MGRRPIRYAHGQSTPTLFPARRDNWYANVGRTSEFWNLLVPGTESSRSGQCNFSPAVRHEIVSGNSPQWRCVVGSPIQSPPGWLYSHSLRPCPAAVHRRYSRKGRGLPQILRNRTGRPVFSVFGGVFPTVRGISPAFGSGGHRAASAILL